MTKRRSALTNWVSSKRISYDLHRFLLSSLLGLCFKQLNVSVTTLRSKQSWLANYRVCSLIRVWRGKERVCQLSRSFPDTSLQSLRLPCESRFNTWNSTFGTICVVMIMFLNFLNLSHVSIFTDLLKHLWTFVHRNFAFLHPRFVPVGFLP